MQVDHNDPQFGGNGVTFKGPTSFDTGLVMQVEHSDPQFGGDGPTSSDTDTTPQWPILGVVMQTC